MEPKDIAKFLTDDPDVLVEELEGDIYTVPQRLESIAHVLKTNKIVPKDIEKAIVLLKSGDKRSALQFLQKAYRDIDLRVKSFSAKDVVLKGLKHSMAEL